MTQTGHFLFWWEWVDSNHLSRKTTDLQSAPALQLRRTPNLLVRAEGIEPSFQAWKACILAFELCSHLNFKPIDYNLFFSKRKHLFFDFHTIYVLSRNVFKFYWFIIWVDYDFFYLFFCKNLDRCICVCWGFSFYIICADCFCFIL